jgi:hypothetical protein
MPLKDGLKDAWMYLQEAGLRPEPGYTYDTEVNKMLPWQSPGLRVSIAVFSCVRGLRARTIRVAVQSRWKAKELRQKRMRRVRARVWRR